MSRVNGLLLIVLMVSAVYLVRVGYDARHGYYELDRAQAEQRQLDLDYDRLKAEKQAQATPLRVEKTARDRLAMRAATPAITDYVTGPADAAAVADGGAASKPAPTHLALRGAP